EIGIYTQAAYVRLLSHFLDNSCFPTSVPKENNFENAVSVFPNPFSRSATVKIYDLRFAIYDFTLYDIAGRKILNLKPQASNFKLERGDLQSGMYFYEVTNTYGVRSCGKIIIE